MKNDDRQQDSVTVKEAARQLSRTSRSVTDLLRKGHLKGTNPTGRKWLITQTHVSHRPTPWGQIGVGDIVWMKWSGGPIIAKSVVQGFRQLRDCSPKQLQETTRGFRLYDLESYWASLKPSFNAVTIYLEHE